MAQSMNGIASITDGIATLENGDLTCNNVLCAGDLVSTSISGSLGAYFGGVRSNLQLQLDNFPPGPRGPPGESGSIGPMGHTGPSGKDGSIGPIGLTGPSGDIGLLGPIGHTGPSGADGTNGNDGTNGTNGKDGVSTGVDIAGLVVGSAAALGSVANGVFTAAVFTTLQAQVNVVELVQNGHTLQIGDLTQKTHFISSNYNAYSTRTDLETHIKSSLVVKDDINSLIFYVNSQGDTISGYVPFDITYGGTTHFKTGAAGTVIGGSLAAGRVAETDTTCETALTITNANNRICQNFKANSGNTNLFNTSDAQIVVVGSTGDQAAASNTGSIYLNALNTYLCSNSDSAPSTYVRYASDAVNVSTQLLKANAAGAYIADASVTVVGASGDGALANQGSYDVEAGSITLAADDVTLAANVTQTGHMLSTVSAVGTAPTFSACYSYIQNYNANLAASTNPVSTIYKADTQRANDADATITVLPCAVSPLQHENAGRFLLAANTFEPSADIKQVGAYAQFVASDAAFPSYVKHINSGPGSALFSRSVGTFFKADESFAYTSDASITVKPNKDASLFSATADRQDFGQMNLNAKDIYLGNATSNVYVSGSLYVPYTNSYGIPTYATLGQFFRQMTRTRAA